MSFWDILLMGLAVSADAMAVSVANGMAEPDMKGYKPFAIAGAFGLFQFFMPLLGYYFGTAFEGILGQIAPYLSFALLAAIGGKMVWDGIREGREERHMLTFLKRSKLGFGKLLLQAVATSIDALAVGVALLAAELTSPLPMHVALCTLVFGAVTFSLSLPSVFLGQKAGGFLSDKAELIGGAVLLGIGLKILLEGVL